MLENGDIFIMDGGLHSNLCVTLDDSRSSPHARRWNDAEGVQVSAVRNVLLFHFRIIKKIKKRTYFPNMLITAERCRAVNVIWRALILLKESFTGQMFYWIDTGTLSERIKAPPSVPTVFPVLFMLLNSLVEESKPRVLSTSAAASAEGEEAESKFRKWSNAAALNPYVLYGKGEHKFISTVICLTVILMEVLPVIIGGNV